MLTFWNSSVQWLICLGLQIRILYLKEADYVNTATCEIDNNKLKLLTYQKTQLTYPSKIWRMVQHWEIINDACQNSRDKNRLELSGRFLEVTNMSNI